MADSNSKPLASAKHPKIAVAVSIIEFLFIAILLGSIDVGVGLVVAACIVLVRHIVIRQVQGIQQWWNRALLWSGVILCHFILIFSGLAIRFQMFGAKVISQFSHITEIVMIAGVLAGGLALTDLLALAIVKLVERNHRDRITPHV